MIDLKMSKKEKKKQYGEVPSTSSNDGPDYPWGFELRLESEQIKKLGLGKMEAGDMVAIAATGKIVQVNVTDRDKEKKRESMEIQIQKIDIISKDDAAKKMRDEVAKEVWSD